MRYADTALSSCTGACTVARVRLGLRARNIPAGGGELYCKCTRKTTDVCADLINSTHAIAPAQTQEKQVKTQEPKTNRPLTCIYTSHGTRARYRHPTASATHRGSPESVGVDEQRMAPPARAQRCDGPLQTLTATNPNPHRQSERTREKSGHHPRESPK